MSEERQDKELPRQDEAASRTPDEEAAARELRQRGGDPRTFFTAEEQRRIAAAIATAELRTSGEIRVHLARRGGGNPYRAAVEVFRRLGMERTAGRSGVLIFLALRERSFALIGDRGIDQRVPAGYWEETSRRMAEHFSSGDFAGGLVAGVESAGEKLAHFFPRRTDDVNELPDEISLEE